MYEQNALLAACALGLGGAAASLVYSLYRLVSGLLPACRLQERLKSLSLKSTAEAIKMRKRNQQEKSADFFIFGSAGAFFAASLVPPASWFLAVPLGFSLGAALAYLARNTYKKMQYLQKLREAALLYESIDLYSRVGYTVRQSLELTLPLMKKLRPVVERCIDRCSYGTVWALEQMGKEIGLKEADVLISLLILAEQSGSQRIAGVMEEESGKLESLRRTLAEIQLAGRPVYMTAYLFLPLAGVMGLFLGPMAWQVINMVSNLRAGGP